MTRMTPEQRKAQLKDQVKFNLANHRPTDEGIELIEEFRARLIELGHWFIDKSPVGRDQSVAITKLEEFSMAAVGTFARSMTADNVRCGYAEIVRLNNGQSHNEQAPAA